MCLVICHFSNAFLCPVRIGVWFCTVLDDNLVLSSNSHQDYSSEFGIMNESLVICSHKLHVFSSFCSCCCLTVVVLRENFLLSAFLLLEKKSLGSERIFAFRSKV